MTDYSTLFGEKRGEFFYGCLGINCAGRVVRGIDNDGLGVRGNCLRKPVEIDLERFCIGFYNHTFSTCALLDKTLVFREERRDHNKFIVLFCKCFETCGECRRRADGQVEIIRVKICVEAAV